MNWLPVLILSLPIISALVILFVLEDFPHLHSWVDFISAFIRLLLIGFAWWTFPNHGFQLSLGSMPLFLLDALALQFLSLLSVLWFIVVLYADGYLQNPLQHSRFLVFSGLSAAAVTGIVISANMLVLLIFYELLALSVYALITLEKTIETQQIGQVYLRYMVLGSLILLVVVIWILGSSLIGKNKTFLTTEGYLTLQVIFLLLLTSFSIKAVLIPFQRWLLRATVLSVPVLALLCTLFGIQIGVFSIMRVIFQLYSVELVYKLGLFDLLTVIAIMTFFYSAVRAVLEDDLLERLTWIAVNQGAYTMLSLSLFVNLEVMTFVFLCQSLFMLLLFFCVGNLIKVLGIHKVSEMQGVAQQMPATVAMFSLGTLGIIGLPLSLIGFITPLFTLLGLILFSIVALLEIIYLFPILYKSGWQKTQVERYFQLKPPTALLLAPWLIIALFLLVVLSFISGVPEIVILK